MFAAVLDTSVLWPSLQRDFLLSLAVEGTYRPLWSSAILDELVFHEAQKLVRRGTPGAEANARADRLIATMTRAFDDALVTEWEPLENTYDLPDPDDRHVVAAASKGSAEAIVTSNLKDFPTAQLPAPIRAISPQEFVYDTVRQHLTPACRAVLEICARSGANGPKLSPAQLLDNLEDRYKMTDTTALLRSAPGLRDALH